MKIALVTLPLHTNYGGILQAYALQRTLAGAGHDVRVANFHQGAAYRLCHPVSVWLKQRGLLPYNHNYPLTKAQHKALRRNTDLFIQKYMRLTDPISPRRLAAEAFDAYVVGSDQVWRHYDPKYFLDFLHENDTARRVAYAASFGVGEWLFGKRETERIEELMRRFDAVSVREDSAVGLCREYMGIAAELVLDPTLLLPAEDYLSLTGKTATEIRQDSVMNYILDDSQYKRSVTERVSGALGLPANSVMPMEKPGRGMDIEKCVWPSVEDWIAGFGRAEFVVTDSFHGTAFALIFNRPFVAICNDERGAARFESLLRTFGLQDRLVRNGDEIPEELLSEKPDFARVNEILAEQRRRSFDFINNALK